MKLSNKILIGFFGFLFIYLTAVFAEVGLRGNLNSIDDDNSIAEVVYVPRVSYLVLNNLSENINVIGSDSVRLEVRSFAGDLLKRFKYTISADTLTLTQMEAGEDMTVKISLFVPRSGLSGIKVNDASVIASELEQDDLYLSQKAGRVWMNDNSIGRIRVEATEGSYLGIATTELDTLSVKMNESQVFLSSPVKLINGSMTNNSFLRLIDSDEIRFIKDESSKLNWYP